MIFSDINIEMCDKPVAEYYAYKYPDEPGQITITLQEVNSLLKKVQAIQELTSNIRKDVDAMGQDLCVMGQKVCETYCKERFAGVKGLDGDI
jgi:hypothetical protein|eukprot:COSAG06_NODE_97_length_24284_cov_6.792270_18_plen_92_part_00